MHTEHEMEEISFDELQAEASMLQVTMERLHELRKIHVSIERFGVGQADIQAATELLDQLEISEIEGVGVYSLESFPTLTYTEERSSVNLTVAQESIGRAILSGLRTLWRRLVEYLRKAYAWLRRLLESEPKRKRQLLILVQINRVVWDTINGLERNVRGARVAQEEWEIYLEEWAKDNPTTLNLLTQAGWMDQEIITYYLTNQRSIETYSKLIAKSASTFLTFVDNPEADAVTLDYVNLAKVNEIHDNQDSRKKLEKPVSVREWYQNHSSLLMNAIPDYGKELIPFAEIVEQVAIIEKTIRKASLDRVEEEYVQELSNYLTELGKATVAINSLVNDYQEIGKSRAVFLNTVYTLLNKRQQLCEHHMLALSKNDKDKDKVRSAMRVMKQNVERLIKSM